MYGIILGMDPEERIQRLREIVTQEYATLCGRLDLRQLEWDIFIARPRSTELTALGTPLGHATASYFHRGRQYMIMSYFTEDLMALPVDALAFPPALWERAQRDHDTIWPDWRLSLWEETIHQLQDQRFNAIEDGHGEGWLRAVAFAADRFGLDRDTLAICLRGSLH